MREAHYAATRFEGILQKHDLARITGHARGEGDLPCGGFGAAAGAETEGEDDGQERDGLFHICDGVYDQFPGGGQVFVCRIEKVHAGRGRNPRKINDKGWKKRV